jgi:hypothetical protein
MRFHFSCVSTQCIVYRTIVVAQPRNCRYVVVLIVSEPLTLVALLYFMGDALPRICGGMCALISCVQGLPRNQNRVTKSRHLSTCPRNSVAELRAWHSSTVTHDNCTSTPPAHSGDGAPTAASRHWRERGTWRGRRHLQHN